MSVILYGMPEWTQQLDTALFFFLNKGCQNWLFDLIMPVFTHRMNIIVIPFLLLFFAKERKGAIVIFAISFFSILLADGTTHALKELIGRERPCNSLQNVHLLVGCSGSFSLPSGHAANSFAFAVPFLLMTRDRLRFIFLAITVCVSVSRIFVGVHYPLDVILGAIVGIFSSLAVVSLYRSAESRFREKPYTTLMYAVLLVLSIFRVYYILYGPLDLSPDEAHYWEWSRRLDLSYYSKGPMIAYLIALSTSFFGDNVFGVRFLAVAFSVLSSIFLYKLGKEMYHEDVGAASAILLQLIPLFSAFGVIFTIDSPFIFFWILSLYLFWKAAGQKTLARSFTGYWLLLGISVGFGLLTKYTMAFFYLCAFLLLVCSPEKRGILKTFAPYLALAISILIFSPVIIWNAGHDWVTFRHTAGQAHLADGLRISLKSLAGFIGSQLGVVTPILLVLILAALRRAEGQRESRFLLWFSLPVIVFFLLKSIQGKVQANWAMTGYITGLIAFSQVYIKRWNEQSPFLKNVVAAGIALSFVVVAVAHYPTKFHIPATLDPSTRLKGWKELGRQVSDLHNEMRGWRSTFIISDSYQTSSELAFYGKGHPVTYCVSLGRRMNQYDLWPDFHSLINSDAIFVTIGDAQLHPMLKEAFDSCEKRFLTVYVKESPLKEYSAFLCHGFKGMRQEAARSY
ncbi:MAG TPA: glycosyltransferase family 39 protein, partial [Thermodesulfovibrionales bacterium]|nr:glycosyltransferase family 39 protein [Thermodesulfovibrionales bacterium]